MAKFNEMSKEELQRITSLGGKASARTRRERTKDFRQIVIENITHQDLIELYKGMLESGKRGNIKAIELILRYLHEDKKNDPDLEEIWLRR